MKKFFLICLLVGAAPIFAKPAPPAPTKVILSEAQQDFASLMAHYLKIQAKLAEGSLEGMPSIARDLRKALIRAKVRELLNDDRLNALLDATRALKEAKDLTQARSAFADASKELIALGAGDTTLQRGYGVFSCPMVKGYAKWLQSSKDVANPYMGKEMKSCGEESAWK